MAETAFNTDVVVTLVAVTCGGCGTAFGMSDRLYRKRKDDHQSFYCPNGCVRHFVGETEEDKLRRQLNVERNNTQYWLNQSKRNRKTIAAVKGQLTKAKKRIHHGVCPCCSRTFQNVARHMKSKHPDYAK